MKQLATALAVSAMLAACGGGDSGGSTATTLSVGVTADGTKAATAIAGQSASVTVESGKVLKLESTQPVTWSATPGKTTVSSPVISELSWSASLTSPEGGTVTLKATSISNPASVATFTITVPPHRYMAVAAKAGEWIKFSESTLQLNGTTVARDLTYITSGIAGGIATIAVTDAMNTPIQTDTQDSDRNRLTRSRAPGNNLCTYAPKRDFYNFPLYVGKTWSPAWTRSCALGYHETAAVNARVEGFEQLATPAGTFDTLRIRYVTAYTNSNDGNFVNGGAGNAAYGETDVCWWSTKLGRVVKCDIDYTYQGAVLDQTYSRSFTQVAASLSQ